MARFNSTNVATAAVVLSLIGAVLVCGTAGLPTEISKSPSPVVADSSVVTNINQVVVRNEESSSVVQTESEGLSLKTTPSVSRQPRSKVFKAIKPAVQIRTGTLRGRVVFDGTPPDHELLIDGLPPADAAVCGQIEHFDESLLVNPLNNGIKNVFVYLIRRPKDAPETPVPQGAVRMTFRGCRLGPRCIVVRKGQEFQIHNADETAHNSAMYPTRNLIGSYGPQPKMSFHFRHSEPAPFLVTCAIHPWIRASILVSDHPFVALTNEDGEFVIHDVPLGKRKFRVYHERGHFLERGLEVAVAAEEIELPELSYDASKFGY